MLLHTYPLGGEADREVEREEITGREIVLCEGLTEEDIRFTVQPDSSPEIYHQCGTCKGTG